jgi:hypothetical protein
VAVRAVDVKVTDDELIVQLEDGRTLAVPLVWYPRLLHGSKRERGRWRFIGCGAGIHWPSLDEDISVEGQALARGAHVDPARQAHPADGAPGAPRLIRRVG